MKTKRDFPQRNISLNNHMANASKLLCIRNLQCEIKLHHDEIECSTSMVNKMRS